MCVIEFTEWMFVMSQIVITKIEIKFPLAKSENIMNSISNANRSTPKALTVKCYDGAAVSLFEL